MSGVRAVAPDAAAQDERFLPELQLNLLRGRHSSSHECAKCIAQDLLGRDLPFECVTTGTITHSLSLCGFWFLPRDRCRQIAGNLKLPFAHSQIQQFSVSMMIQKLMIHQFTA
jgi:hypothetical protein